VAGGRPETSRMESSRDREDVFVSDQANVVEIMTREAINEAAMHGQLQSDSDGEDDERQEQRHRESGSDRNQFSSRNSSPEANESQDSEQATNQQMQQLFSYTSEYQPEAIELFPELKCFVPDYIPAIGDIDPMIKVCRKKLTIRYLLHLKKL
jgi:hypothetical protein